MNEIVRGIGIKATVNGLMDIGLNFVVKSHVGCPVEEQAV
jgi:hypothetical protein